MADREEFNNLAVEDKDLIQELFKANPEYADFLLAKAKRVKNIISEIVGEIDG